MKQMRMTPSRRDFLRLTTYNDLIINNDTNRFITYKIKGQLKKRQALKNFNLFIQSGYLIQVPSDDPNFLKFTATQRTFNLFRGL